MKNSLLKFYLFSFIMLSDFITFAQGPGTGGDGDGGLEGDDPVPTPINGKLIWLAITGILFALYIYKREQKAKIA